jgi:hypothetical protein
MPMFRSGRWYTPNGHEVRYAWDEQAGRDGLDGALRLIDRARQHPSGRLDGALYPAQVDTCTEELLRDSAAAARERRLPLQIHAAQSVVEFQEIMRRHGRTPIGWLRQIGVLGDNAIIGHAIFLDHHSWLHWPTRNDLGDLADTGTTVAHCPTVFSRRGILLEDFGRYRAAGVNLGIGTDTFPHNFVEELRTAAILARIAAGNAHAVTAADIFTAATIGGARALGHDDLARITPGAKADFMMVDIAHPAMQPLYDPVRSMVYAAGERAVRHVCRRAANRARRQGARLRLCRRQRPAGNGTAPRGREGASPRLGRTQCCRDHAADLSRGLSFRRICSQRPCRPAVRRNAVPIIRARQTPRQRAGFWFRGPARPDRGAAYFTVDTAHSHNRRVADIDFGLARLGPPSGLSPPTSDVQCGTNGSFQINADFPVA